MIEKMNLEVFDKREDLDIKRFYFPARISGQCKCGATISRDFTNDYISYPCINDIEMVSLYCENDHETIVHIRLKLDVKLENTINVL